MKQGKPTKKSKDSFRGRKLNPNFFFSDFSGTPGISRQNPGISRQKSLISLVSRGIPNFLAPTRSRGRPLPRRKISGLKSLGLGSFFVPGLSLCQSLKFWGEKGEALRRARVPGKREYQGSANHGSRSPAERRLKLGPEKVFPRICLPKLLANFG